MASYSNTFTQVDANGNLIRRGLVTMSNSYTTGGEAITAANAGVGAIKGTPELQTVGGYVPEWVSSTGSVKVRDLGAGTEVVAGSDLSGVVFPARFTGIPID